MITRIVIRQLNGDLLASETLEIGSNGDSLMLHDVKVCPRFMDSELHISQCGYLVISLTVRNNTRVIVNEALNSITLDRIAR